MSNLFGGFGKPKIKFDNGITKVFPEPLAPEKEGLKVYDFKPNYLSKYRSEGETIQVVGMKWQFIARLRWNPLVAKHLKDLFQASEQDSFLFYLNEDEEDIVYRSRIIKPIKHTFFQGDSSESSPGYNISIEIEGTELLNSPGYGSLQLESGYATDWGTDWGKQ